MRLKKYSKIIVMMVICTREECTDSRQLLIHGLQNIYPQQQSLTYRKMVFECRLKK